MAKPIDLSDQQFGRLIAIDIAKKEKSQVYWTCKCECGNVIQVITSNLRNGSSRSCGCLNRETISKRSTTHGLSRSELYITWRNMVRRCYSPKDPAFKDYGGRGIKVCQRWKSSVTAFVMDMGPRPKSHSLDRRDNDGDYCPENCRWASQKEQASNTRRTVRVVHQGIPKTLSDVSEEFGIRRTTIAWRLKSGDSVDSAITTPVRGRIWIDYNGEKLSISEIASTMGIREETLRCRIQRGWDISKAVRLPLQESKLFSYNGIEKTCNEWAESIGIESSTLRCRLDRGWSIDRAIETPVKHKRKK